MRKQRFVYLCEVVIRNHLAGRRFMLRNEKEVREFGLSPSSVRTKARQSRNNVLYGIKFIAIEQDGFVEEDAILQGYGGEWGDISALFIRHPARFRTRSKPIIGMVMEGKYQGTYIALFSLSDIAPYFPVESVRKSIIDRTVYYGIKWRYGADYNEAEFYYRGESTQNEILTSLNIHRPKKRGWLIAGWKYSAGYQNTMGYLIQAEKVLIQGDSTDGLVLLHKALGEYQALPRRKKEDEKVSKRFAALARILTPKAGQDTRDVINTPETRTLIKALIRALKIRD